MTVMNLTKIVGVLAGRRGTRDVVVDERGKIILSGYVVFIEHPFGKGAITATGAQFSPELVTDAADVDRVVEQVMVGELLPRGQIIELEFGLTGGFRAGNTTADLIYTWQGRNLGSTSWETFIAVTKTDINTTVVEETYSGRYSPASFGGGLSRVLNQVPFQLRLIVQANEASQGKGKTKNSSYVKVTYLPD